MQKLLKKEELEKVMNAGGNYIMYVYTQVCILCEKVAPVIKNVEESTGKLFYALEINDDTSKFAIDHSIYGVPAFLKFENGIEKSRIVGLVSFTELEAFVKE